MHGETQSDWNTQPWLGLQHAARRFVRNREGSFAAGEAPAGFPPVRVHRFAGDSLPMPQTENPYLYLVLDGILRLHTPSGILDYMAGQYSVSRIDTPLSGAILAPSEHQDFLALSVEFTVDQAIDAILNLDNDLTEKIMGEQLAEEAMAQSDAAVFSAVYRLFASPEAVPSAFLWKNRMREVLYFVLCGSCGRQLLQSIGSLGPAEEIYQINSWIKENFRSTFTVEELARQKNMSVSLFHQKFKSAVGMGPLQCQKRLRLTEARRQMLSENRNVTEATLDVGYESLSQFIRDYRKMFCAAPKEDIQGLRHRLQK